MELLMVAGGDSVDYESLTASPGEVMEGKGFLGAGSDEVQTGTVKDRSQRGTSPGIEGDETIPVHQSASSRFVTDTNGANRIIMCPPDGIYPGEDVYVGDAPEDLGIVAEKIAYGQEIGNIHGRFTEDGTAAARDMRAGKRAYVKGQVIDGALADKGAIYKELSAGETYTIGEGVYSEGRVVAKNLSSQTQGTAAAGNILFGKTVWVNGSKVTGSMAERGTVNKEISAGETYTINEGHFNAGYVKGKSLSSQTQGTAAAGNILSGKTAWVNGNKVTGSMANQGQYQYGGFGEGDDYYAINSLPEGAYFKNGANWAPEGRCSKTTVRNYLGVAANKIAKGQTIAGVTGSWYGNKTTIGVSAYDARNASENYAEQSFTMPASGTVYYGGCAGGWYYPDGDTNATCAIYKNGSVVNNANISSGNYTFRGGMFNRSFSANAGDVIKVVASCSRGNRGDFIMSAIQAVIVY